MAEVFSLPAQDCRAHLSLLQDSSDCSGSLLETSKAVPLAATTGKKKLSNNGKTLHKGKMHGHLHTPWRKCLNNEKTAQRKESLQIPSGKKAYGHPMQILNGVIAVNYFISMINAAVEEACPFSGQSERLVFIVVFFYQCQRLSLFLIVSPVPGGLTLFIFVFNYSCQSKRKGEVWNLFLTKLLAA